MTDPIFNNILRGFQAANDASIAMVREGVVIGRREAGLIYRPLIKELCNALDAVAPAEGEDREEVEELIARVKQVMDEAQKDTAE